MRYIFKKVISSGLLYYWRPHNYSAVLASQIDKWRLELFNAILDKSAKIDYETLSEIQLKLAKIILFKADKTFFWRNYFFKNGFNSEIKSLKDLENLPILTKNEIKKHNLIKFFSAQLDRNWAWLISTSGTTGTKVEFLQDKFGSAVTEAFFKRALGWAGLDDQRKILILNFFRSWNQNCGIHINLAEKDFQNTWFTLNHHEPEGLFADVDTLVDLAAELENQNKSFKLKSVAYNGRRLYEHEEELIKRIFGCEPFSFYGASECGIIASECSAHNGLHINAERVYVETVDGSIIITVFDNEVMPLIRYRVGDAGRIENSTCVCGMSLPRLFLEGREKNG